jgi:TRAP-type transport system large permease protein
MLFVMTLMIGMLTPPVGIVLFVTCSIADMKLEELLPELWAMIAWEFFVVLLIIFVPPVTTFVPRLFGL